MGFQSADVFSLGRELLVMEGVSGVWVLAPSDHEATAWITVKGFDDRGALDRQSVYRTVERFLDERAEDLGATRFAFDYFVLVDDDDLGEPQIPDVAQRVAA